MQEQPTPSEILASVAAFLRDTAVPQLSGHAAFNARVAANAVDLVRRELALRAESDSAERARLRVLLGRDDSLDRLTAGLCRAIAGGEIATDDPALLDHLWHTTMAKLAIDQPGYASYRAALASEPRATTPDTDCA